MSATERLQPDDPAPISRGGLVPEDRAAWILVADDELVVRDLLQRFLELEGYKVMCATDGIEAVELFRRHAGAFQAMIVDVLMPRMDGCAAFHEIRRIDPAIPVLVMTGFTAGERAAEILGKPETSFIAKPFVLGDVLAKLEGLMGAAIRPRTTWLSDTGPSVGRLEGITD